MGRSVTRPTGSVRKRDTCGGGRHSCRPPGLFATPWLASALTRGDLVLTGDRVIAAMMQKWLGLSPFAKAKKAGGVTKLKAQPALNGRPQLP